MRLRGPQTFFAMRLRSVPRDPAEWCSVGIEVQLPQRPRWSANDNCLRRFEVEELADWLEALARSTTTKHEFQFTEAELALQVLEGDCKRLRVYLGWNFRPKWAPTERGDEFYVEFPVTEQVLEAAAESLRAEIKGRMTGKK